MWNAEAMNTYGRAPMEALIEKIASGKRIFSIAKGQIIFSQGEAANALYFIINGTVKVTVLSATGKEAVLAVLGPQDFCGEECLAFESLRINSATSLTPATLIRIERQAVLRAIQSQPELSVGLMSILLMRKNATEEDFCDQLFNQSEKRLARALLKLARIRKSNTPPDASIPALSHEMLSEMIGTTRARVTHFMNKFRKMGLIDYHGDVNTNGRFIIRSKLLTERFMLN
jgi:CRP-like cAMP-binding protein